MAKKNSFIDFDNFDDLTPEEIDFFSSIDLDSADDDTLEAIENMAEYYDINIGDPAEPGSFFMPEIDYSIFQQEEPGEELGDFELEGLLDDYAEATTEEVEELDPEIEIITSP